MSVSKPFVRMFESGYSVKLLLSPGSSYPGRLAAFRPIANRGKSAATSNYGNLMMARKKRRPYEHSGKLIKHRTAKQIESEVASSLERLKNGLPPVTVTFDYFRDAIEWIYAAEQVLFESAGESERQIFEERTSPLQECRAWIALFEKQCGEPLSENDARALAYNAMSVGIKIAQCNFRLCESSAVSGMKKYEQLMQNNESRTSQKYDPTREELLSLCKKYYMRHECSQADLQERIANSPGVNRSAATIKAKMKKLNITKKDYEK